MPAFQFTDAQVADIAAFLHSFPVSSRTGPSTINILVGDPKKGEAYVAAKCASVSHDRSAHGVCRQARRSEDAAADVADARQRGGRGGGPAPIPAPPISVTVTMPSGEAFRGRLSRIDDFTVSLTQADGTHRTFRTVGDERPRSRFTIR